VVEQRSDFRYSDDDLTTLDRFDSEPLDSSVVDPSVVDLFDYLDNDSSPIDSSPIGRLKALVLSIDWEITDEVLRDFNEELVFLRGIWGGDPIKAVYLQALEKISKYIYRTRSEAHPDAVKLLPLLFVDLEKIVQEGKNMSEDEKKQLLIADVRRFERLKAQILERHSGQFVVSSKPVQVVEQTTTSVAPNYDGVVAIKRLKAQILGIDWEITEKDLMALRREVLHLEGIFAHSRPKQLFLQGIGTLSAYIRNKKSNAHADAFSLLHDFFGGLERVVTERLDFPAEKAVLLSLVSRFNTFKETIASTLSAEAIAKSKQAVLEEEAKEEEDIGPLQPAFADLPDNLHGFHIEEEALSPDVPKAVIADIEKFFTEEDGPPLTRVADAVNLYDSVNGNGNSFGQPAVVDPVAVAPEVALRGINVETEADDDSSEAALPRQGGQLAPALSDEPVFPYPYGGVGAINQTPAADAEIPEEISNRLDDLFSASLAPLSAPVSSSMEETESAASAVSADMPLYMPLQGVDVDADVDDERYEDSSSVDLADWHDESEKEPAPALSDVHTPELRREADEAKMEFSPAADDEPEEESEYGGGSAEIVPALSDFDDANMPERSEFAEEDDDAVVALENEEILAFFQDKSPDAEGERAFPFQVEKSKTLVADELEILDVPQQPDVKQRQNFVAFLSEDAMPGQMPAAPATVGETYEDKAEQDDVIAFLSDELSSPAEEVPIAGKNAGSDFPLTDETEPFVDDFFAGKSDQLPADFAESAVEESIAEVTDLDAVAEVASMAEKNYSQVVDLDVNDASPLEEALSADVELPSNSTPFSEDISLRECVNALADEINDDILDQSYREVRRLRAELDNQPLAEIYLQFISAIMQHIDQRRANASDEALPLLRQTLAHLEESRRNGGLENIHRFLLYDTQAVLAWQQSLLQGSAPAARPWL